MLRKIPCPSRTVGRCKAGTIQRLKLPRVEQAQRALANQQALVHDTIERRSQVHTEFCQRPAQYVGRGGAVFDARWPLVSACALDDRSMRQAGVVKERTPDHWRESNPRRRVRKDDPAAGLDIAEDALALAHPSEWLTLHRERLHPVDHDCSGGRWAIWCK